MTDDQAGIIHTGIFPGHFPLYEIGILNRKTKKMVSCIHWTFIFNVRICVREAHLAQDPDLYIVSANRCILSGGWVRYLAQQMRAWWWYTWRWIKEAPWFGLLRKTLSIWSICMFLLCIGLINDLVIRIKYLSVHSCVKKESTFIFIQHFHGYIP